MIDYYKLFGLERQFDVKELEEKYREKLLGLGSEDIISYVFKTKYFREGYEILKNIEKRNSYNQDLDYLYLATYMNTIDDCAFSYDKNANKRIVQKLEETIIEALIANPNLVLKDFYNKYLGIYERKISGNIKNMTSSCVYPSEDALVALVENNYNFYHNIKRQKQKIMTKS